MTHKKDFFLENSIEVMIGVRQKRIARSRKGSGPGSLTRLRVVSGPTRGCQKLEHRSVVLGHHLREIGRHRFGPEEVVVERVVGVEPLLRVERE